MNDIHFGKAIKQSILQAGITIKEFASAIGKSEQQVYRIFKNEDINTELLKIISNTLSINVMDFFSSTTNNISQKGNNNINALQSKVVSSVSNKDSVVEEELELLKQKIKFYQEQVEFYKQKGK